MVNHKYWEEAIKNLQTYHEKKIKEHTEEYEKEKEELEEKYRVKMINVNHDYNYRLSLYRSNIKKSVGTQTGEKAETCYDTIGTLFTSKDVRTWTLEYAKKRFPNLAHRMGGEDGNVYVNGEGMGGVWDLYDRLTGDGDW